MELRHLRYFMAVAEGLSFRGAADKLRVAQPALSAQIKSLEDELGVKLLERTTRSVSLTNAGRVLLEEARTVLKAATRAENRARHADRGLVGTLRIGIIAPSANAWLSGVLSSFRAQHPGVELSFFDLPSIEQLHRLREHDLDVGFLRPPIGLPQLDYQLVEQSPQMLALPEGHRLVKKKTLEWIDFHEEPMVVVHPNLQHGFYDAFFAQCARAGATPRVAQTANDIHTKMWLISAGLGLAPTTSALAEIKRPGLALRAMPPGLPLVQTVMAWHRSDESPVLSHFRECFPTLGQD
ncbi:MAG: LysR family transcriptional regulator [Verrucomicrobiaceae bacterium]|nr:LysR family transcriptional regulator [Verrucomicrobiaceae bacterium]